MKFIASFALVAALCLSSCTAASLDSCPGNELYFDLDSASFAPGPIGPSSRINVRVKGWLKTSLLSGDSKIKYTLKKQGVSDQSWKVDLYNSMELSAGTTINTLTGGGVREMTPYFYLPSQLLAKSGDDILVTILVTTKDKDRDEVRVVCVKGVFRIA